MKAPEFILHPEIKDLVEVRLDKYQDDRGANAELYNKELYNQCPQFLDLNFKVDSISYSCQNCIRGFHGDAESKKLVQCIAGNIQLFVIDLRDYSPTYNNILEFNLNSEDEFVTQILIPENCVNAHAVLSPTAIFGYKIEKYVSPENQLHVRWNAPHYTIPWKVKDPILSMRDQ